MSPGTALAVSVAGLLAGAANSIAGGGTLIAFPALLALGLPPISANVTSSVGLTPGYLGGAVSYRRQLSGQVQHHLVLAGAAVLGSLAGAGLLLVGSDESFELVVPYLILVSCLLLAAQPRIAEAIRRQDTQRAFGGMPVAATAAVTVAGVYGGYFGAGLGVVLLAVLSIFLPDDIQRLNGIKLLLSLVVKMAGFAVYLFSGEVSWGIAAVLLPCAYLGGYVGAVICKRLAASSLRYSVAGIGFGVACLLLWTTHA